MKTNLHWHEATPEDETALFTLIEAFYAEEQIALHPASTRAALRAMLQSPHLGRIFLLKDTGAPHALPRGYAALAFWHSLEFGGRVVLFDEFYLAPSVRGRGLAPQTLDKVRAWARAQDAVAVRLEVNHHNRRAMKIYLKSGFQDDKRDILTFRL